jgi:hypothetical protein
LAAAGVAREGDASNQRAPDPKAVLRSSGDDMAVSELTVTALLAGSARP